MIFAVLDPSPLTVCINCSFLHLLYIMIHGLQVDPPALGLDQQRMKPVRNFHDWTQCFDVITSCIFSYHVHKCTQINEN